MKSADQLATTIDMIPALMGSWLADGTTQDPKRLEALPAVSDLHLRQIVDGIPALITVTNAAGELEFVNRQVEEYFGKTLQELKSWTTGDAIHPGDLPRVVTAWRQAVETGRPYDVEERLRGADGVYRWFHTRGFPLRDTQRNILLWYLIKTDVDDLKRNETLLAAEKQLLEMVSGRHTMSEILEAICRLVESTASGCYCSIVLVDQSGTRLEHGAAPSLPASFISSIIGRPVNRDSGPCAMAAFLNEQVIAADLTTETRWTAYEWCPMALAHGLQSCWSTPIASAAGKALGAFALYYSQPRTPTPLHQSLIEQFTHIALIAITRQRSREALRKSEDALRDAEANLGRIARMTAMGELVVSIGHEVNQPLMAMVTNADACLSWLASDRPQLQQVRKAAQRIVRDGHRAGDIIKSIRALAKKVAPAMTQLDINGVIAEVLVLMGGELRRHDIVLETELTAGLEPVIADRIQLQQVILNLVTNGIEAMSAIADRSRVLRLSTRLEGTGAVLIRVADTGAGLDQATKDRIFDAFFTTKSDGMGMGLSICRSIAEAHGGRLWASPNLPYGSIFEFSIPVVTNRSASDDLR